MERKTIQCRSCQTPVEYNPDELQGPLSCSRCGETLLGQREVAAAAVTTPGGPDRDRPPPAGRDEMTRRHPDDREPRSRARGGRRRDYDDERPKSSSGSTVWIIVGGLVLAFGAIAVLGLFYSVSQVRDAAMRMASSNNLRQIGVAGHNYASANMDKMPQDICDKDGKPLLSWRVAILPYIDQDALYRQFKLDEPWDGPNNVNLLNMVVKTYLIPGRDAEAQQGLTYYQGFAGPGTAFDPKPPRPLIISGLADGTSNTIWVVEASEPVAWTKPGGLPYGDGQPLPRLGGHFRRGGYNVLLCDGSVRFVSPSVSEQSLRAGIRHDDGQFPGPDF